MTLARLTRFPGPDIPAAALTGNPVLDEFLKALDRELLGSARVRLQTLAEIRDHLLERKVLFGQAGGTETGAAEKAVHSIGTPDELAGPQRRALKKKFLRVSVPTGIMFGLFMGIWGFVTQDTKNLGPVFFAISGLCQGACFGLFFGWFMTFIWPERQLMTFSWSQGQLPSTGQDVCQDVEGDFTVHYSAGMRRVAYFATVFFALTTCAFLILAIAGYHYPSLYKSLPFTWWVVLILGILSAIDLYFVRLVRREYKVDEDGILIREFIGRKKRFDWDELQRVGLLGEIRPWVPYYWKTVRYADFQKVGCKPVRMLIYPDMINADRLFVLLDQNAQSAMGQQRKKD